MEFAQRNLVFLASLSLVCFGCGGSGSSGFGKIPPITTSVAIADVNSDGHADVLLTRYYHDFNTVPVDQGELVVYLQRSDAPGSYRAEVTYPLGESLTEFVVEDLDGDGRVDVAGVVSEANEVAVLFQGSTPGVFLAERRFQVSARPRGLASGDFDGDGLPDLAVLTETGVSLLIQAPGSSFSSATAQALPAGQSGRAIASGDFDGDQRLDLVVARDGSGGGEVLVFLQDPTPGLLFQSPRVNVGPPSVRGLVVADLDGDQLADLALSSSDSQAPGAYVQLQIAQGGLGTAVRYGVEPSRAIVVGDFNGDSLPDLAFTHGRYVAVAPQDSAQRGRFLSLIGLETSRTGAQDLAAGSLDGDARLDLVVPEFGAPIFFQDTTPGSFRKPRLIWEL
jgi:VCBS repeat protein